MSTLGQSHQSEEDENKLSLICRHDKLYTGAICGEEASVIHVREKHSGNLVPEVVFNNSPKALQH